MAEPQPPKLVMRVRSPPPAPAEKTVVTGPKQVAALISSGSLPKSRATDGPQQAVLCITPGLLRPSRSAGPDLLDEAAEGLGYSLVAISGRVCWRSQILQPSECPSGGTGCGAVIEVCRAALASAVVGGVGGPV